MVIMMVIEDYIVSCIASDDTLDSQPSTLKVLSSKTITKKKEVQ